MTKVAKIALIGSEVDRVCDLLLETSLVYGDDADLDERILGKIERAVAKTEQQRLDT